MKTSITRPRNRFVPFAWMLMCAAGCTEELVDIDRTSPNKIEKSLFEGEWYFNSTVVETEFNQGIVFEGLMSGAERVVWDLQEDVLIARRAYAIFENAEEGNTDTLDFQGTVVAMFPIESHFDVFRDFNTATGEQSNVLIENTTDRPWWERDFVRIDWSTNLVADSYNLSGVMTAISAAPFYVQEHEIDNPFRAEIGQSNINVVGNYVLAPDVGVCSGALQDTWCGSSTARMKLSFMRVPEDGGLAYEPLQYPDGRTIFDAAGNPIRDCDSDNDGVFDGDCVDRTVPMFERFGFFRTERRRFDDDALWTRDGRIFLANRWNIWQRSQNAAGTTIPYENREVRKITFHTNVDFPREDALYAMNDELLREWDDTLRNTVAQLRTLGGIATAVEDVENVLEWRENSCSVDSVNSYASANGLTGRLSEYGITDVTLANVKRACAVLEFYSDGAFTWEKIGDLRHSFLHWADSPQQAGPLGYGPVAADPVTGEIIAGYSNVYGASIETYAAFAADIAQLLDGSVDPETFANGTEVREQIGNRRGFGNDFNGASGSFAGEYSSEKMQAKREQFAQFKADIQSQDPLMLRKFNRKIGDKVKDTLVVTRDQDLLDLVRNQGNTKLDRLAGSRVEKELLLTDEIRRAMHGQQWEATAEYQSPLRWMQEDEDQRTQRELIVGQASIMMADWADEGVLWLAEELAGQNREQIYARARAEIYRAVQAHEVGHTLGLRHNFEGSYDALNFHDEFWDDYNPSNESVERVRGDGTPTDAERYMYSSIMDYMPRPFDDWGGVGKYDAAAIAFGYGQLVEVWAPQTAAFYFDDLQFLSDYSTLPRYLGGDMYCDPQTLENCHPDAETALTTSDSTESSLALNSYLFKAKDAGSLPTNAQDAVDRINARRYVTFDEIFQSQTSFWRGDDNDGFIDVFFDQVEVPYSFCPDERVFPSNEECQRWDKGANYREIIADRWERYDKYYWFNNFKRDRASFDDGAYINSYVSRIFNRHLGPMASMYQNYLFGDFLVIGDTLEGEFLTFNDFETGADWQAAALDGLNYLGSIVNSPEPGSYCMDMAANMYMQMEDGESCSTSTIDVPLGVGKYYLTEWSEEYQFRTTRVGTIWDKWVALNAMTDNSGLFFQDLSDLLDSGSFSLSYWRGLPDEMLDFFGALYNEEAGPFAWRMDSAREGDAQFVPPPISDIYTSPVDSSLPSIEPSTSFTLRYYAMALSMARFNSVFDYTEDFAFYTRVCLEGSSDCLTYDGPTETYVDPISRYSYVAPRLGESEGRDVGAQLLRDAQDYADTVYVPAKSAYDEALDDPQGFAFNSDEQVLFDAGTSREQIFLQRQIEFSRAKRGVNEHTSFVDILRDIAEQTEFGG